MGKKDHPPQASMLVATQFRFEHRDSQGRLIASSKNLKAKYTLKNRLKRLFRIG